MRQIRRLCTSLLVLLGAITIVPAFGGTASAHAANITASVTCAGTVSWTATSWSTGDEGTNPDIRVTTTVNGSTAEIAQGAFNSANNYQFSGTFEWPADTATIIISTKPFGTWGNGNTSTTGGSTTVSKPADCPAPPPDFGVTAICNSVSDETTSHWFTITNTASTDIPVTWNGGAATIPAGQSIVVSIPSTSLVLQHNGQEIASANAADSDCESTVTFTKELQGAPASGETYTIRVSRFVGTYDGSYVEVMTFDIAAGESKIIHLPSTMDPAGIDYKFEEIVTGTANTSVISPNQLTLSGNLGETVNVAVTNGYAAVQIDKTSFTSSVVPGGQITYTLQATNTGGLTLDPVVISDRLPSVTSLVSASVAGGAGQCVLTETTRPQLLTCTMSEALAPGAVTSVITVVVNVDTTAVAGSTIVNQAMVHGAYAAEAVMSGLGASDSQLSCVPVVAGTVCDLSAQVGVPVATNALVASAPPAPPAPASVVAELPRTGTAYVPQMLVLAFGGVLLGGVLLIGRRRIGIR